MCEVRLTLYVVVLAWIGHLVVGPKVAAVWAHPHVRLACLPGRASASPSVQLSAHGTPQVTHPRRPRAKGMCVVQRSVLGTTARLTALAFESTVNLFRALLTRHRGAGCDVTSLHQNIHLDSGLKQHTCRRALYRRRSSARAGSASEGGGG